VTLAARPEFRDVQFNFVTRAYVGPVAENIRVFDDVTTTRAHVDLYREADFYALPTAPIRHAIATARGDGHEPAVIRRPSEVW